MRFFSIAGSTAYSSNGNEMVTVQLLCNIERGSGNL